MSRVFFGRFALLSSVLLIAAAFACQPAAMSEDDTPAAETAEKPTAGQKKKYPANRLAEETSPYLLMHAHNPVRWMPWGEEALAKAKRENKLIFLSIGYSSCYWCHVMERESFMDEKIAEELNEHFVPVKVDREERPDVDAIYMRAVQAMTGRGGGWPLSVFLTPEAGPFIGGTYYPPYTRGDRIGFFQVLERVKTAWSEQEAAVLQRAEQVTEHLKSTMRSRPVVIGELDQGLVRSVGDALAEQFDARYGGFGFDEAEPKRPKFPEPSNLLFLIEKLRQDGDDHQTRKMLLTTLERMAGGGIYDHLGGGFHRYSTDRFWRVPHFEKMLYDNGQLASVYALAYERTGRENFRRVAAGICDFVLRDMTDEAGGFYSAIDAETDEHEGLYYIWKQDELKSLLSEAEFSLLAGVYGVAGEANFEGYHVLAQDRTLAEIAAAYQQTEAELVDRLNKVEAKLLAVRQEREHPLIDTKILTAWNGLMIGGLADTGRILQEPRYIEAASRAARFVLDKLRTDDGRLLRSYRAGQAKLNGYLDDYAMLVSGLLSLHEATGEEQWLTAAAELTEKQIELFGDEQGGGFFFTSHDHPQLILRSKDPVDGAIPAGNSVAAENLLQLAAALDRPGYAERAEKTMLAATSMLQRAPLAMTRMATAVAKHLARTAEPAQ